MVRPTKLQTTPSGTYYNLGVGVMDTVTVSYPVNEVKDVIPVVNVMLFPNPVTTHLNINIGSEIATTVTMQVLNIEGKSMAMTTKQLKAGDNAFSLSVAVMPSGIYTLLITTNAGTICKKWVKE